MVRGLEPSFTYSDGYLFVEVALSHEQDKEVEISSYEGLIKKKLLLSLHIYHVLNRYNLFRCVREISGIKKKPSQNLMNKMLEQLLAEGLVVRYVCIKEGSEKGDTSLNVYVLSLAGHMQASIGNEEMFSIEAEHPANVFRRLSLNQFVISSKMSYSDEFKPSVVVHPLGYLSDVLSFPSVDENGMEQECFMFAVPQNDTGHHVFVSKLMFLNRHIRLSVDGPSSIIVLCPDIDSVMDIKHFLCSNPALEVEPLFLTDLMTLKNNPLSHLMELGVAEDGESFSFEWIRYRFS